MGFENKMLLYRYCRKQRDISRMSLLYVVWPEMVADTKNKFSHFQLHGSNECLSDAL